ncbi:hypothetical protein CTAM01_10830 [Colletotrichum tamarilloi]|uniref:Heterokaryon incompatibility domain-containing protein n=1 Tax=Colletotrichum tamarilloi TaxID=1209934 RepID=A0ABQ9QZ90_9PEZI|nr:uncharacterized protein CTAM01_10830 [Colletotrichum tamarilloi]KAK1490161.1 hypothetical protein CTAM01_10830 [Colletotrichum tamarilloi]
MPGTGVQAHPDAAQERPPCTVCCDLDKAHMPGSVDSRDFSRDLRSIIKAGKKGCQICYAIKVAIFWGNNVNVPKKRLMLDDSYAVIHLYEAISIQSFVKYRNFANNVILVKGIVDLFTKPGKPLPWKSIGVSNEVPLKLHSKHRQKTIRGWVDECNATHKTCGTRMYPSDPGLAPRRFLDLGKSPRNGIKLVDSCSVSGPYITVVHGYTGPLPAPSSLTTSENFDQRQKSLQWWQIPVALQETMTVASELGIQYAWVQDFCVIQDIEEDVNWHLAREDIIFGRSYLTIALTSVKDLRLSNFGPERQNSIAGVENAGRSVAIQVSKFGRTHYIYARQSMHWYHVAFANKTLLRPMDDDEESNVFEEHHGLFQHAPAFQRLLLSRRVLYLHKSELVWDCLERPRCECDDPMYFGQGHNFVQNILKKPTWISRGAVGPPDYVLKLYKALTPADPEEKLAVVAGLFRHILRLNGRSHFAGIAVDTPEELSLDLLWTTLPPERAQLNQLDQDSPSIPDAYRHHTSRIPSWSWASMVLSKGTTFGGASQLSPGYTFDSFDRSMSFGSVGMFYDELPGSDDGLLATNYRIKAKAAIRPITAVPPMGRRPLIPHLFSCYDGDPLDRNSHMIFRFLPDCARLRGSFQASDGFKCYIMLLGVVTPVGHDREGPINQSCTCADTENHMQVGLVLRESLRNEGAFERIGTFAVPESRGMFLGVVPRDLTLV